MSLNLRNLNYVLMIFLNKRFCNKKGALFVPDPVCVCVCVCVCVYSRDQNLVFATY